MSLKRYIQFIKESNSNNLPSNIEYYFQPLIDDSDRKHIRYVHYEMGTKGKVRIVSVRREDPIERRGFKIDLYFDKSAYTKTEIIDDIKHVFDNLKLDYPNLDMSFYGLEEKHVNNYRVYILIYNKAISTEVENTFSVKKIDSINESYSENDLNIYFQPLMDDSIKYQIMEINPYSLKRVIGYSYTFEFSKDIFKYDNFCKEVKHIFENILMDNPKMCLGYKMVLNLPRKSWYRVMVYISWEDLSSHLAVDKYFDYSINIKNGHEILKESVDFNEEKLPDVNQINNYLTPLYDYGTDLSLIKYYIKLKNGEGKIEYNKYSDYQIRNLREYDQAKVIGFYIRIEFTNFIEKGDIVKEASHIFDNIKIDHPNLTVWYFIDYTDESQLPEIEIVLTDNGSVAIGSIESIRKYIHYQ